MTLEQNFQTMVEDWRSHCREVAGSSNPGDFDRCDAVERIVALGRDALPLIVTHLAGKTDADESPFGWAHVIRRIAGDQFQIPAEIQGDVAGIRRFTKDWVESFLASDRSAS